MKSSYARLLAIALVTLCASFARADSWQIVLKSKQGDIKLWVDEKYGIRMTNSAQPNLAVLMRVDVGKTIMMDTKKKVHATMPSMEEIQKQFENLPPEAREALNQKKTITYESTNQTEKIGKYNTEQMLELVNGEPSGKELWVADHKDWRKVAAVFEKTVKQAPGGDQNSLNFGGLKGIPIRTKEKDGSMTEVVSWKSGKLEEKHMSPKKDSKEVPFFQLMQAFAPGGPGGPGGPGPGGPGPGPSLPPGNN